MQHLTQYLDNVISMHSKRDKSQQGQPMEKANPDPEYFSQSRELLKVERDLRFRLGLEACTIIGKVRALIDRYIRRNGHYPKFGDIMAKDTSKLSKNLNDLERIVNKLDSNHERLQEAIDTSYQNAEKGNTDRQKYQKMINSLSEQINAVDKVLAGQHSEEVHIKALRAKNTLMHKFMQYARKEAMGRATKEHELNGSRVLIKLKKVGYALQVNSENRLIHYRCAQKSLAEIVNTMELLPEALRKCADIEDNYLKIQHIARTYRQVTGALMKLEAGQLEYSLGQNAGPIMENDL